MKLYQITQDSTYLDYANKGAAWLTSLAVSEAGGYKWQWTQTDAKFDITICHGVAGMGDFLLELYKITKQECWLKYARGSAIWLESVADSSLDGYRWATFGEYHTGYSIGTAGVGLFFLKMAQTTGD